MLRTDAALLFAHKFREIATYLFTRKIASTVVKGGKGSILDKYRERSRKIATGRGKSGEKKTKTMKKGG